MLRNLFIKTMIISASMFVLSEGISANTVYLGLVLGGHHMSGNSLLTAERTHGGDNLSQSIRTNHSDSAPHGDLILGYGRAIDQYWAAVEGHVGLSSLETKSFLALSHVHSRQELTIKSSHNAGVSLHLGHQVNESSRVYLKLGAEVRKFAHNFNGSNYHNDNLTSHSKGYYSVGLVPGFGIETQVTPLLTLRTEYKSAIHGPKSHKTNGNNNAFTNVKSKSAIHHMSMGLHFKL